MIVCPVFVFKMYIYVPVYMDHILLLYAKKHTNYDIFC